MIKEKRYDLSLVQALEMSVEIWEYLYCDGATSKPDILDELFECGCPLCEKFNRRVATNYSRCRGCPLKPNVSVEYGCCVEYKEWGDSMNPKPMLNRLKRELKTEKKKIKERQDDINKG